MAKNTITNTSYWLYIEPVVYITFAKDDVLFYHTENGNYLVYHNNLFVKKLAKRLLNVNNNYCISITEEEKQTSYLKFIAAIRKKFIGDIVPQKYAVVKPFIFKPIFRINNSIENIKQRKYLSDLIDPRHYYLTQLSIITNSISTTNETTIINAHNQFFYPKSERKKIKLSPNDLLLFIRNLNLDVPIRINITGSDLFENPALFAPLIEELIKESHTFHLYLPDIEGLTMNAVCTTFKESVEYHQYINLMSNCNYEKNISDNPSTELIFIVSSDAQLEQAEMLIDKYQPLNFSFQLYYNEVNFNFLKRNTFLTKNDILENTNSLHDIFRKSEINPYFFGEIMISPEGNIFSNLYQQKLGNIYNTHYNDIISAELMRVNFWRLTRLQVKPCKNCIYRLLCPPITNYEKTLGRNNLCYKSTQIN